MNLKVFHSPNFSLLGLKRRHLMSPVTRFYFLFAFADSFPPDKITVRNKSTITTPKEKGF